MKNLTYTYILALTIIAIVIAISQLLVQRAITTVNYDSRTINVSGRQRMLSQKITKAALAIRLAENQDDFNASKEELANALQLLTVSQDALLNGSKELALENVNNSESTLKLFKEVEPLFEKISEAANKIINLDYEDPERAAIVLEASQIIQQNEGAFLKGMNAITFDYDSESSDRLSALSSTEYVLFAVALGLLLLEAFLIFRPAINKIKQSTNELIEKERNLQEALHETKVQVAKVDYLNQQAETVFNNVNQGIFLLDKDYGISDMHSAALKDILMDEDVSGKNFVDVLKPRLVQRDVQALEMFIKHLYNPDIEAEVLDQLNPVSEVELYQEEGTTIEPKHVKISFSRIGDQEDIKNVLVNVSDETEAVKLQEKIKQAEEKNKKEAEQLLSILKVDPKSLREFLDSTKTALAHISESYEHNTEKDLSKLVDSTFVTIHNLKGNAQIIDLHLMADKFHEIEDILTDLRLKPEVVGNDFLKILYEINNVDQMIANLKETMSKISDTKSIVLKEDKEADVNRELISSLRKGLDKMLESTDKKVQLNFIDTGVTLPEQYGTHMKDVLIQLMRNSFAHGIESVEERKKAGKSERATITIKLQEADDEHLLLTYIDDGKGINLKDVILKSFQRGTITKEEVSSMTKENAYELLFKEGFSTAEEVSQYAGRGEGMGLVKSLINEQKGSYKIVAPLNKGFKMEIRLPKEHKSELV